MKEGIEILKNGPVHISVPAFSGIYLLNVDNIIRLEAFNQYTYITMKDHKRLCIAKRLSYFDRKLRSAGFIRCHPDHLVSSNWVEKISPGKLYLVSGDEIVISRKKIAGF